MAVITSDEPYSYSWSAPGPPKNSYEQAAQGMMQAGIGSLSGNQYDGLASMMTTSPAGNNYYLPNFNVVNSNTTQKIRERNNNASGMSYSITDFVNPNTGNIMSMSEASNAFAPFRQSFRFVNPDGSGYEERGGKYNPIQLKGPQTWRINPGNNRGIQAALNNKYKVMPATSYIDPTADDYFLREFYNKFMGNYDIENDESNYQGVPPEIYDMDEALKIDEERSSREFNKFQEKFEPVIQTQSRYDYEDLIEQGVDPMEGIFQDYMPYPGGGFMGRNRYVKPEPELVAGMDDSWQYLQQQMDELDPDGPNYDDMLEMLMNDMEMKYPYMVG